MAKGLRKTFKREMGVISVFGIFALAIYAVMADTPELVTARAAVVTALAFPAFSFAAFAFGADWVAKQTDWGGDKYGSDYYGGYDPMSGPRMPPPSGTDM